MYLCDRNDTAVTVRPYFMKKRKSLFIFCVRYWNKSSKGKTKNGNASFSQWNVQFRVLCVTDSKLLGVFLSETKTATKTSIIHSTFHIHSNKNDLYCVIWVYIWVRLHILHMVWTIYGPVCMSVFSTVRFVYYFCVFVFCCVFEWHQRKFQTKVFLAVHRPNQCAPTE